RNGNCRRGVAYVVNADERQLERAERRTATTYVESRRALVRLDVVRLPIDVLARAERLDARYRGRRQLARRGAVGADEQETTAWHEVDQPAKREPHGIEIGVDVSVIEFDVVDDGDVRQVLQELRRLVEERAVVLVALDQEIATLSDAVARSVIAQIGGDPAHEHARIQIPMRQQPSRQRRGRRLAVSTGDHD